MNPKIELLAPGGDVDAIKAAVIAGADAVYCGLDTFNARNRASNISFEELVGIIRLAHEYDCQIFLTLNIVILEREFKTITKLLNKLVNTTLDGVIVQDIGLFYILKKHYPTLDIHASTQMTTHNVGQIPFLKKLGASRVNLSRELNLREISAMAKQGHDHDVLTEVFVHGSLCVAFSGLCYSTSASVGNSGNRGRCSQACREEYKPTESGNKFPLNIKDNSAFFDLPALIDAGVRSFKVEGRIKGASYVHTVIDSFRKQIDGFVETGELTQDGERLYKVFNRDFSNAFIRGDLNQSMFIENPRDNSKNHAVQQYAIENNSIEFKNADSSNLETKNETTTTEQADKVQALTSKPSLISKHAKNYAQATNEIPVVQIDPVQAQEVEVKLNQEKDQITASVFDKIKHLSIEKINLTLAFSGNVRQPLTLTATTEQVVNYPFAGETKSDTFTLQSTHLLKESDKGIIDKEAIEKRFKNFGNAEYHLQSLNIDELAKGLSVPFKELTLLKNALSLRLNKQALVNEIELPKLERHQKETPNDNKRANLSVLICDEEDVALASTTNADIYFKLPDAYKRGCTKYVSFLQENPRLIPWFPPVLIGKDYDVALNILEQVKPELIVTNNTGIAYRAYELGIKWIAGPFLNTTNSYVLLAMQEEFNCSGAFISNEINKQQIKTIARPKNFKMLYSIYHPILLMASRQCFFQQSVGCEKPRIDNGCMLTCDKSTSITNLKGVDFAIDKQKAGYPSIYNKDQFLNTEVIDDLSDFFDDFMIDLTNIGFGDKERPNKEVLIKQFEQLLTIDNNNDDDLAVNASIKDTLKQLVPEQTNIQYHNGL